MGPVTILRPMSFSYNTKNYIPLNELQYKMVNGADWIGYNIRYKLLAIRANVHIVYNTISVNGDWVCWVSSSKYIQFNFWVWCEHWPQLPELCTQYWSQFNMVATIFVMQVLTYPVYLEIPFFNQMVLDFLCLLHYQNSPSGDVLWSDPYV